MFLFCFQDPNSGRYKDSGVLHSWDMWHGAKNLAKKITAVGFYIFKVSIWTCEHIFITYSKYVFFFHTKAGQLSGQKILLKWTKDIVNHFWFCCKTAETDGHFRVSNTFKIVFQIRINKYINDV